MESRIYHYLAKKKFQKIPRLRERRNLIIDEDLSRLILGAYY